jgi:hypothetical protein
MSSIIFNNRQLKKLVWKFSHRFHAVPIFKYEAHFPASPQNLFMLASLIACLITPLGVWLNDRTAYFPSGAWST